MKLSSQSSVMLLIAILLFGYIIDPTSAFRLQFSPHHRSSSTSSSSYQDFCSQKSEQDIPLPKRRRWTAFRGGEAVILGSLSAATLLYASSSSSSLSAAASSSTSTTSTSKAQEGFKHERNDEHLPHHRPRLYLFTRYPTPGQTKTRLMPALGAEGAALFHRRLVHRALQNMSTLRQEWVTAHQQQQGKMQCRVRYTGVEEGEEGLLQMQQWLGLGWECEPQGKGGLGQRLYAAVAEGKGEGAGPIVLIGSDCPLMTPSHLEEAFEALLNNKEKDNDAPAADLVLGPALDGGYYLIGMREAHAELFKDIEWSTEKVLKQTLAVASRLGLRVHLLTVLSDMDYPEDLPTWRPKPMTSVVIPVLNEASQLSTTLASISSTLMEKGRGGQRTIRKVFPTGVGRDEEEKEEDEQQQQQGEEEEEGYEVEVIVVDGGSDDDTRSIALAAGVTVILSPPGRAVQMNIGAAAASGDLLLFLHGDTQLPSDWHQQIRSTLFTSSSSSSLSSSSSSSSPPPPLSSSSAPVATAFRLSIRSPIKRYRWLEKSVTFRSRFLGLPYGDQAIAIHRQTFESMGGFPNVPIMEDVRLIRTLRKQLKGEVKLLDSAVTTSARRWESLGIIKTTLINQLVLVGWYIGVPPERLANFYRRVKRRGKGKEEEDDGKK